MNEYKLPDVGEGLTEAEIVSWKVKVGDVVKVNDIVVEIETAKSIVELPTPYAGAVTAIHVAEGEMVSVGTVDSLSNGRVGCRVSSSIRAVSRARLCAARSSLPRLPSIHRCRLAMIGSYVSASTRALRCSMRRSSAGSRIGTLRWSKERSITLNHSRPRAEYRVSVWVVDPIRSESS